MEGHLGVTNMAAKIRSHFRQLKAAGTSLYKKEPVGTERAHLLPEEPRKAMKSFAFPSQRLTGSPSSSGVYYEGVRPYQKFDGSHTLSNK